MDKEKSMKKNLKALGFMPVTKPSKESRWFNRIFPSSPLYDLFIRGTTQEETPPG